MNCITRSAGDKFSVNNVEVRKITDEEAKRAVRVAKYLVKEGGLTDIQASAAAGVFLFESGCNPYKTNNDEKLGNGSNYTRNGGYGAGIQQWSGVEYKRQTLKQINLDTNKPIEEYDLCDQAKMVVGNIYKNDKVYYDLLKTKTKLEDAVIIMDMKTLRPGDESWKKSGGPTLEDELRVVGIYVKGAGAYNNNRFSKVLGYAQQVLQNWDNYDDKLCQSS